MARSTHGLGGQGARAVETAEAFRRRVGLADARPVILYAASAPEIAPNRSEVALFRKWLTCVRNANDAALREVNVLIQPHPANRQAWDGFVANDERVLLSSAEPVASDGSLAHSVAVVGLNTAAMLEAGLVGTPVIAIFSEKFADKQDEPRFQDLRRHGLVDLQPTMALHLAALAAALGNADKPRTPHPAAERAEVGLEAQATSSLPRRAPNLLAALAKGLGLGRRSSAPAPPGGSRDAAEIEAMIAEACAGDGPILVGPWLSEVGFEVLYWIPFLRWVRKRQGVGKDRLVIISRGGARAWYGGLLGRYVDVLEFYTPAELHQRNLARAVEVGHQKQTTVHAFDREIYDRVAASIGVASYGVLHPRAMFRLFQPYWVGEAGQAFIDRCTRSAPITMATARVKALVGDLPERFVAVKFYFRESFPDTPQNKALAHQVVERLAEHNDVVVLGSGARMDDHADFAAPFGHRVHRLNYMESPGDNLEVQTAVLSRAEAFVGTYGGLTYVAGLLGKTCLCFQSLPEHNDASHTALAQRRFAETGASLHIFGLADLALLDQLIAPRPSSSPPCGSTR
jgi:hypothetical protein